MLQRFEPILVYSGRKYSFICHDKPNTFLQKVMQELYAIDKIGYDAMFPWATSFNMSIKRITAETVALWFCLVGSCEFELPSSTVTLY